MYSAGRVESLAAVGQRLPGRPTQRFSSKTHGYRFDSCGSMNVSVTRGLGAFGRVGIATDLVSRRSLSNCNNMSCCDGDMRRTGENCEEGGRRRRSSRNERIKPPGLVRPSGNRAGLGYDSSYLVSSECPRKSFNKTDFLSALNFSLEQQGFMPLITCHRPPSTEAGKPSRSLVRTTSSNIWSALRIVISAEQAQSSALDGSLGAA
jgi:hypothetical protein